MNAVVSRSTISLHLGRVVLLIGGLLLLQGDSCGESNPCAGTSDPLYCPHNGGCCPAGYPYECTIAGTAKCQVAPFAPGVCSNQLDYCSVSGSEAAPPDGYEQCAMFAQAPLYCDTYAGPQLLNGVPGECCSIGAGATSQVGYLCVYGNTSTSGGVCQDMNTIASGCPTGGTIVRCCYGSPC